MAASGRESIDTCAEHLYDAAMAVHARAADSVTARQKSTLLLLDFVSTIVGTLRPEHDKVLSGLRTVPSSSQLAFEVSARSHFLDYDDSFAAGKLHTAPIIWPSLLAFGDLSGRQLISAHIASVAGLCALSEAATPEDNPATRAFFLTQLFGSVASALAGSIRIGLGWHTAQHALGIAFMQTGGTKEPGAGTGSSSRQVYPAYAAMAGAFAVEVARAGIEGPPRWVEGPAGLARVFLRDDGYPDRLRRLLEDATTVDRVNQVSCKAWPCCRSTHKYLTPFLDPNDRTARPSIAAGDVVGLRVLDKDRWLLEPRSGRVNPSTLADAKFSIPFVLAMALTGGVGLPRWDSRVLADPAVTGLAGRLAESAALADDATLQVRCGGTVSDRACEPPGGAGWTLDVGLRKFDECWQYSGIGRADTFKRQVLNDILHIDEVGSVQDSAIGTLLRLR